MIPLKDDTPTRRTPVVGYVLIVAIVGVFIWQITLSPDEARAAVLGLGMVPAVLFGSAELPVDVAIVPPAVTVLTSMFLHGGWLHLLGNLLFLWIFANNVEDSMGHGRFIAFYVVCGIVAALAQAAFEPTSRVPMIGASGAISGVLGAYLLLLPRARILVLVWLGFFVTWLRLPAVVVLGLWFVFQLLQQTTVDPGQGGVAFMAHIAGFIAGMLLIPLFRERRVRLGR